MSETNRPRGPSPHIPADLLLLPDYVVRSRGRRKHLIPIDKSKVPHWCNGGCWCKPDQLPKRDDGLTVWKHK